MAEGGPLPSGAAGGGGGASGAPPPSLPNADVIETAQNTAFVVENLTAPADTPFTIAFDNKDQGQPHNMAISDASGTAVYTGKIITGPEVIVYDVPALAAGNYTFVCSVHPNMTGTLAAS